MSIRRVIDRCSAAMSFITDASRLVNGRPRSQERSNTSTGRRRRRASRTASAMLRVSLLGMIATRRSITIIRLKNSSRCGPRPRSVTSATYPG